MASACRREVSSFKLGRILGKVCDVDDALGNLSFISFDALGLMNWNVNLLHDAV